MLVRPIDSVRDGDGQVEDGVVIAPIQPKTLMEGYVIQPSCAAAVGYESGVGGATIADETRGPEPVDVLHSTPRFLGHEDAIAIVGCGIESCAIGHREVEPGDIGGEEYADVVDLVWGIVCVGRETELAVAADIYCKMEGI